MLYIEVIRQQQRTKNGAKAPSHTLKHMNKKISTKEISVYIAVILVILMAVVIACNPGMDENISALKQFLGAAIELAGVASIFYLAYVFVNWIDKN